MQDEENLVKSAQNGDEEAFTQLYEEYFDRIYRYVVLRVGNEMEAEDITQQVFLRALRCIGSFKFKGPPFSSWLFRIAHNQVIDYIRRRARRTTVPLEDVIISVDSNIQEEMEKELDIGRLKIAVQHLTPAQQEVISFRFTGEMATAEVAKIMGKSVGAIKALQHSAILALRKALAGG